MSNLHFPLVFLVTCCVATFFSSHYIAEFNSFSFPHLHTMVEQILNPTPKISPAVTKELAAHASHLLHHTPETLRRYHSHRVGPNQVSSAVVRHISASVSSVWSVVRRFDNPLTYKHFLKSCHIIVGDGDVGTLREVRVISGLPAEWSTERLDVLDEERHVISFSVVDGRHKLKNYRSVMTLHHGGSGGGTVVVESYVVDVPVENTRDETCLFADTIVRCNLNSLARIAEKLRREEDE